MKNKFSMAVSLAVILAMLLTSLALADNVNNDVTVSNPSGVTLIAGDPGTATVGFKVVATGGDGDLACNIDSGESLTIAISTPMGVTASPASLTFTSCGGFVPVTFAADLSGVSGTVSVSITGNSTGTGTYNLSPASFPIPVNAPPPPADITAPDISYVLNPASPDGSNGWYVNDVTLTCSVDEPESPGSLVLTGCVDQSITA
jgi:hypothetical protein